MQPQRRTQLSQLGNMEAKAARGASATAYPVDAVEDALEAQQEAARALAYYTSLGDRTGPSAETFCLPTGEQVKLETSSVCMCTVHRDEPQHKILVLVNPRDTKTGSLCGDGTSACYLLPVFDTVFVRRIHRRQGLGTAMLRDFCETFQGEEALGFSRPISPAMFQEATEDSRSWGEGRRHPALLKFSLSLLRDPPAGSLSKSAGNSCWPVQRSGDACGKWSPRGPGISASTSGSRFSCSRQEFRMEQSVGGEVRNGKSDQDHGEKEEGPGLPVRPR
ncbi:uncharacterized protein Fam169b isoform X7 [Cavia porcellus]|uniref:uncharacterized protein Fam169b isoform X7 n=1 Tax=Cavia porcellus TaxID=10141 RepID=UPI000661F1CB